MRSPRFGPSCNRKSPRFRAELKSDLKIIKFVYGPAVLLMLAKLVFFP